MIQPAMTVDTRDAIDAKHNSGIPTTTFLCGGTWFENPLGGSKRKAAASIVIGPQGPSPWVVRTGPASHAKRVVVRIIVLSIGHNSTHAGVFPTVSLVFFIWRPHEEPTAL
ncbi:hypothetical protein LZ31DRAFT_12763 [Colletotrichum somersetense]|nr:hypothetical protein LZ31DRAFT_12763 [Colletotrichum somersetense]